MRSNSLPFSKTSHRNITLALYIAGITVFMAVYTTLTLTQYL